MDGNSGLNSPACIGNSGRLFSMRDRVPNSTSPATKGTAGIHDWGGRAVTVESCRQNLMSNDGDMYDECPESKGFLSDQRLQELERQFNSEWLALSAKAKEAKRFRMQSIEVHQDNKKLKAALEASEVKVQSLQKEQAEKLTKINQLVAEKNSAHNQVQRMCEEVNHLKEQLTQRDEEIKRFKAAELKREQASQEIHSQDGRHESAAPAAEEAKQALQQMNAFLAEIVQLISESTDDALKENCNAVLLKYQENQEVNQG